MTQITFTIFHKNQFATAFQSLILQIGNCRNERCQWFVIGKKLQETHEPTPYSPIWLAFWGPMTHPSRRDDCNGSCSQRSAAFKEGIEFLRVMRITNDENEGIHSFKSQPTKAPIPDFDLQSIWLLQILVLLQ